MKIFILLLCIGISCCGFAQTVTDGLMMPKKTLCTGFVYTHDQWTNYWEGELKRENDNIGTVTTATIVWMGNYGITDKINVIVMAPYVKTKASQGTLVGMEGIQDLSLTVKYNFLKKEIETSRFKVFGALTYSTPLTDYTPDFYPLSLGSHTQNLSWRATANYALGMGLYFNASGAYTWRSNTKLDRPSYFTNNQLYMSDEVKMPDVFDFAFDVGYHKGPLQADVYYAQMNTLGGGDIRRQDMPFVSNRMNAIKLGAFVMYYVSAPKGLALRIGASYTAAGRNVGQSATLMAGVFYTIKFSKPQL